MVQACSSWFRPKGLWICCSKTCIDWHTIRRCASHWVQSSGPLKFSKPCKKGQYLSLMTPRALLWLWPIRTYHPSWFLSLWLAASQSQFNCADASPADQCSFPPCRFQLTSSIGTSPSKAIFHVNPQNPQNVTWYLYILICTPQHETPMIPDAQHIWIWTVHF